MVKESNPTLVSVTVSGELVVPTSWGGKLSPPLDSTAAGSRSAKFA